MVVLDKSQIQSLARSALEIDEKPSQILPPFFARAFEKHVARYPNDTNFIVEFAKPDSKGSPVGGNGFGIATCLENFCWNDVRLGADPEIDDGGKSVGFGSLWEYQVHCDKPDHVRGRDERCSKSITYEPSTPSVDQAIHAVPPVVAHVSQQHATIQPTAGPSRNRILPTDAELAEWMGSAQPKMASRPPKPVSRSSQASSSRIGYSSSILQPTAKHNSSQTSASSRSSQDIKPTLSQSSKLGPSRSFVDFLDANMDDDEVTVIPPQDVPDQYKRNLNSNRLDPVLLLSDDEDDIVLIGSSASQKKPTVLQGRQGEGSTNAFSQMMQERYPPLSRKPKVEEVETPKLEPCASAPARPKAGPSTYPSVATQGAQSQSMILQPAAPYIAPRYRDRLAISKRDRDDSITRDYSSLISIMNAPTVTIDARREIWAYAGELLALINRPASHIFPTVPAILFAMCPWYQAINTTSKQKHNDYSVAEHVVLQASSAWAIAAGVVNAPAPYGFVPGAHPEMDEEEVAELYGERYYEANRPSNLQDFFSNALKDFSNDENVDGALRTLGLAGMDQKFADMTVTLMPHQILGVAFMLEKEKDLKYRGGLLCDAMGLGKTVQTIAVIAGNQSTDRRVKTTLIVAPLAVLNQWKDEIESKTAAGLFNVYIHHGQNKAKNTHALKNADVVLTTYGTLVADFAEPKKKKTDKKRRVDSDNEEIVDEDYVARKKGPIFRIKWYRVVLDEAHFIRNRNTQASKAVADLDSIHRWSLTGTLINNSLDDVFPHLRFLGISPQQEWKEFSNRISKRQKKSPQLAAKRIQAILKTCMMRRHKESTLNGQRLLTLPPKETVIEELDFTAEEREIYNQVEMRMKIKFGKFLKQGTVLKHLSCVLTMLMRLRQLTCHPWLLRRNPGDPAHPDDFQVSDEDLNLSMNMPIINAGADFVNAVNLMGEEWVVDVTDRLKLRHDRMINAPKRDEEAEKDNECSICLDIFTDESITSCKHSYCRGCIDEIFQNAPRDGTDLTDAEVANGARKCPMCRAVIERNKLFAAVAFFDPEKVEDDVKPDVVKFEEGVDRKGKRKSTDDDDFLDVKPDTKKLNKGKAKAGDSDDEAEPIELDDITHVLPSTKMKILGQMIDEHLAEDGIKVIVFSEFVSFLKLCSVYLEEKNIPFSMYHGGMRHFDRQQVVKEFSAPIKNAQSPRVMLISRKAGGAGLNLTAASKVISLDLAWNAAAENQAVDRAHRIGQTKPVNVRRLVIQNTVEQRILELQERKSALADGAMGEGTGGRLGRLSVQDLMRLFDYDGDEA